MNMVKKFRVEILNIGYIYGWAETEIIFGPEAQALKEIESIIGIKPRIKVENRRITEFSVSYRLPHDKLYPALEKLFNHCKNLKILDVAGSNLTSLQIYPMD